MDVAAVAVARPVEYSTDKWFMDRVPWALWVCVAGLAIALNAADRGENGPALALVYLAALAVVFAGLVAIELIERSPLPFLAVLPIVLIAMIVVTAAVAAVVGLVGGSIGRSGSRPWHSRLVDPPFNVFGWMLIYLGGGWIAYALLRHVRPARPIIVLSPAGFASHRFWLRDLVIPWSDVQGVGLLETAGTFTPPSPFAVYVVVSRDFHARQIAPKLSRLAAVGAGNLFIDKVEGVQMVLTGPGLAVDLEDLRRPIEARWHAFRAPPPTSGPAPAASPEAPIVYGRWRPDGSWWQTIQLLAPLVALCAVGLHASGMWLR